MNELIKITEQDGKQAVSAHELYNFLCETQNESFGRWWERQASYGFSENVDYQRVSFFTAHNNQEVTDYALTLDCAKEISMIQRSEKRMKRIATLFRQVFSMILSLSVIATNQTTHIGIVLTCMPSGKFRNLFAVASNQFHSANIKRLNGRQT